MTKHTPIMHLVSTPHDSQYRGINTLTYGEWLKRSRRRRNITQETISDRAGIGRSHISAIENGRIGLPEGPTRLRIHAVLGTTEDDLVEVGILEREVDPRTGEAHYEPARRVIEISGEARGSSLTTADATLTTRPAQVRVIGEPVEAYSTSEIPASLRASFLRAGDLDPDLQRQLMEYIDTLALANEGHREQMRRDRERREAEGIEE